MALKVDEDACIGCELCVQVCPEVFEMNGDGKGAVKAGVDESSGCVDEAIDSCPTSAIVKE
ncbi:MAG: ferredoxin [Atribacterota bacterium]|nr:ferredoxin [Candidatus Atribacteria bacterium]